MRIPRIIHQTWKTEAIPAEYQLAQSTWQAQHPDWQYQFWTDQSSREFVATQYPDFLHRYDSYPKAIQRVDVFRYLALHHFGGLYADLDTECLKPFDELLSDSTFAIAHEPDAHTFHLGGTALLGNAIFASVPKHPFLDAVLQELSSRSQNVTYQVEVLHSTGPAVLHAVYERYQGTDITVLPSTALYQANNPLFKKRGEDSFAQYRQELKDRGAYAIHYWDNTWTQDFAGRLQNTNPDSIPGYVFFQGLDSPGYDSGNFGRDITKVASRVLEDSNIVGFNTDGFVKHYIRPRRQWSTLSNGQYQAGNNEGLYIKEQYLHRAMLQQTLGVPLLRGLHEMATSGYSALVRR